jgi:hypothetical protein
MKTKLLLRISLPALIILGSGLLYQSTAQVVIVNKTEKKSSKDIFSRKRTHPVIIRNQNNLPPGHAKKIYGEKSAKRFAPGQRKKAYHNNWHYNKNSSHLNKKRQIIKKHHDD